MEVTIIKCDLCYQEIHDMIEPYVIKTKGKSNQWKRVGCDIVLTPPGNRLNVRAGKAMIRVNASFYCGHYDKSVEELHFHPECIDTEVRRRVVQFFKGNEAGRNT